MSADLALQECSLIGHADVSNSGYVSYSHEVCKQNNVLEQRHIYCFKMLTEPHQWKDIDKVSARVWK